MWNITGKHLNPFVRIRHPKNYFKGKGALAKYERLLPLSAVEKHQVLQFIQSCEADFQP